MVIRPFPLTNKFLRKHRKFPISPYKTKWHESFSQNQALQTLKRRGNENPNRLLSLLIDSFNSYDCNPTPEAYHFVLKTLIMTSQFTLINSVLDRIESVEKFETPEYFFSQIVRFYGFSDRIEDAIDLFCRIPKFRCVPSSYSLNSLLYVLCRRNEGLRFVPQILIKSRVMNIRLEESSFRILITALCRIGKVGHAIEILDCMIGDGYDVDARICSLILSFLCGKKNVLELAGFEVLELLEKMKKVGFCPRIGDYSKVIRILVREKRGLGALDVLGQMKADGMKPDVVCYTMVLDGMFAEGEYRKADKLFNEMLVLGVVPDAYTYNAYISGLSKQNNIKACLDMIHQMEILGCKPNLITYNLVMGVLCKNGEVGRAKELVAEMNLRALGGNFQTYRIMLDGLCGEGEIIEACVLMEEMLDKFSCRCCSTFDEIIFGLCQRGLVCKALEMMRKMVGKNVAPGAKAWEALLRRYGSELTLPESIWISLANPVETLTERSLD